MWLEIKGKGAKVHFVSLLLVLYVTWRALGTDHSGKE